MRLPLTYEATPSLAPVSSVRVGLPITVTFSEKVTLTSIVPPVVYAPSLVMADTAVTVGAVVSIMILFAFPRDPEAPGLGNVNVALFVAASLIVPPLRPREVVAE